MAGDWIKMRGALCTHPKVLMIAEIIGNDCDVGRRLSTGYNGALLQIVTRDVTRDIVIGCLLRVWHATNEHTDDGVWKNSTIDTIDSVAGVPGFGAAMASAGWAVVDEEKHTVSLPNFLEYNAPAKNGARSSAAERQARYRDRKRVETVTKDVTPTVTRDVTLSVTSVTREEKRREEQRQTPAPKRVVVGFDQFWSAYPKKKAKADAERAFTKINPNEHLLGEILAAVQRATTSEDWRKSGGQFIPHPATWLNDQRWLDEADTPLASVKTSANLRVAGGFVA